jgi:hypothetical protein
MWAAGNRGSDLLTVAQWFEESDDKPFLPVPVTYIDEVAMTGATVCRSRIREKLHKPGIWFT